MHAYMSGINVMHVIKDGTKKDNSCSYVIKKGMHKDDHEQQPLMYEIGAVELRPPDASNNH